MIIIQATLYGGNINSKGKITFTIIIFVINEI